MAALVDSITGLVTVLIGAVDVLPALALGIYGLGAALLFLGASSAMSALGIGSGCASRDTALVLIQKHVDAQAELEEKIFRLHQTFFG